MIVVADASPLIALAIIEKIEILNTVFDKVIIPKAVFTEITQQGKPFSGELKEFCKGKVLNVKNKLVVKILQHSIDPGEAEAIALALENNISNILMDDNRGRKQAILEGIQPIGTLGVLLQAKKIQQIKEIKPLINKLVENNIRISNALIAQALRLADETNI
jgi:predicted nucleic acid-binding protein